MKKLKNVKHLSTISQNEIANDPQKPLKRIKNEKESHLQQMTEKLSKKKN